MSNASTNGSECVETLRGRKRKSRWSDEIQVKACIQHLPTTLPHTLAPEHYEAYLLQIQINELTRQLRTNDPMIPHNREDRSPSPPPIYDSNGKRVNTRAYRARKKAEELRHQLIQRIKMINPLFKPPADYNPPPKYFNEKVFLPQDEYPHINFIGLLIGPRGSTMKAMEKDSGAKIAIRGKGSTLQSKVSSGWSSNEPLHVFISANSSVAVANAVKLVQEVISQEIEKPDSVSHLRKQQLYLLAQLNGTTRPTYGLASHYERTLVRVNESSIVCAACGGGGHLTRDCNSKRPCYQEGSAHSDDNNKCDELYLKFLAEINEQPSSSYSLQPQNKAQAEEDVFRRFGNDVKTTNHGDVLHTKTDVNGAVFQQQLIGKEPTPPVPPPPPGTPRDDFTNPVPLNHPYSAGVTLSGNSGWGYTTPPFHPVQFMQHPPPQGSTQAYGISPFVSNGSSGQAPETTNLNNYGWMPTEYPAMYGYFSPPTRP